MLGNQVFKKILILASLISPSKIILFERQYQAFDTVFQHQMKHLEIRQKYFATRLVFNSLLGVSSGDETLRLMLDREIFVRPWNENARTKQKQQTNGNRAIWLVYRTDTNARGFWLDKRTLGWKKNFMLENFLEINRYFALTSYWNTIGQSNNAFSILGFSLAGKRRGHSFDLFIHWLIKQTTNTYPDHFSRSYENRSI